MEEFQLAEPIEALSFWDKHRFLLLIGITIVIAMILVSISMAIYSSSGAAQLDLSRPGLRSVITSQPSASDSFDVYPQSGSVDAKTVNEFQTLYSKKATNAKAVDAFGGDPLDPVVLGISAPVPVQ